uniref:Uncharacterized protein n=1 Tax=Arundo donax TaxID=35708 RepID=A0A0A8Y526_ARUDO
MNNCSRQYFNVICANLITVGFTI